MPGGTDDAKGMIKLVNGRLEVLEQWDVPYCECWISSAIKQGIAMSTMLCKICMLCGTDDANQVIELVNALYEVWWQHHAFQIRVRYANLVNAG
jgi:transcription elongation factor Elf1